MLIDKTVFFQAAHDKARMRDAAIPWQRAKVQLLQDAEFAKFLPERVAVVDLELADGTRRAERVSAVDGTLRNPMSRSEVSDKARDLIGPVLGQEKSKRPIESVYAIEAVKDVRVLKPLLQRT
jgi:2-methylcitrate dehydratase PrpD